MVARLRLALIFARVTGAVKFIGCVFELFGDRDC